MFVWRRAPTSYTRWDLGCTPWILFSAYVDFMHRFSLLRRKRLGLETAVKQPRAMLSSRVSTFV